MDSRAPHWLAMSVHFMDETVIHAMDPRHVQICCNHVEFCRDIMGFNRGVISSPTQTGLRYALDRIGVFMVDKLDITCSKNPENDLMEEAFVYQKAAHMPSVYRLPVGALPCVFFHEEKKTHLESDYNERDNRLQTDLTDFSALFAEQTPGVIPSGIHRYWADQKAIIKQNSFHQLKTILAAKEYGEDVLRDITAYQRSPDPIQFVYN